MVEEVYKPLDGYKAWSRTPDGEIPRLCDHHRAMVGQIRSTRKACWVAPHDDCDGLRGYKIVLVVIHITRQEGKTTAGAAYVLSDLDLARNSPCLYFASAETQAKRVFDEKFTSPILSNPGLKSRLEIGRNEIRNPLLANSLRYIPTSARSIAAGSYRLLIADEIRDVPGDTIVKAVVQVVSAKGLECRLGHHTRAMDGDPPEEGGPYPHCPTCGLELEEWHGRALLMSSSGEDEGLLPELVGHLRETPDRGVHLFSTEARLNPSKSLEAVDAIDRVFGALPSTQGAVDRELRNVFARKGDEFLPVETIKAITNASLHNLDASELFSVGFLDCSQTNDLTSLVVGSDPTGQNFSKLVTTRIDLWDPTDKRQCPNGRVDYRALRHHLVQLMGGWEDLDKKKSSIPLPCRFPNMIELQIDTSIAITDAKELYLFCREQPWGGKVSEYNGNEVESMLMWDQLEIRALSGRDFMEIQDHSRLREELRRASIKTTEKGIRKVVDSPHGNRRGGRKRHRDVSMSLAGVCRLASKYAGRGTKMVEGIRRLNESLTLNSRFRPIVTGNYGG